MADRTYNGGYDSAKRTYRKAIAAKDAEIAQLRSENERLREMRESQINYSIKLQRLLESIKREDTPYPELHHHQMVTAIKTENAALREKVAALQKQLDAANLGWA